MKSVKLLRINIITLTLIFTGVVSCNKDIEFAENLPALQPASTDTNAETWLSVNNDATDVTVAKIITAAETSSPKIFDPTNDLAGVQNINSAAYQAELTSIKDLQKNLTGEQKRIIKYWSVGGVLRWNEILRGLVAKFSLPPAPLPSGTYPLPDAENPFADPGFPFSNPPYSARAYSYVSNAQYEGLKAAWHYMYLYNRKSPYVNDTGVQSLMPETGLPSYPSCDAVISGVSAEMLKLLFPAALEEITLRAAEQRNSALWSGRASSSDIAKGLALGKSVAALFTTRARGDGMGAAAGTKAQWDVLADSAKLHYTKIGFDASNEIFWKSMDTPARPPMLPFFGNVKGWNMSAAQFKSERNILGPPPSTSSEQMKEELEEVRSNVEKVDIAKLKIVQFWADGAGTYTPPGHWNDIAAEYISNAKFSEVRAARAFALLNMAMHDAGVGCWNVKYYWYNPRPSQLNSSVKTLTGLPNFPSYISGHSTFSTAASTVLSYLFPSDAATFNAYKEEASISRLYGGIHYMSDIEKGKTLGAVIGGYTVAYATGDGAGN